jgi:arsenite-transporting ATPase
VAVFHAFSRVVSEARSAFVVLDTAPTGHSLLLMDATGAYHRQMVREFEGQSRGRIVTPLMRLQDPDYTKIILVTLPETTPVSQAQRCKTTCAGPRLSRLPGSSTKACWPRARTTRC